MLSVPILRVLRVMIAVLGFITTKVTRIAETTSRLEHINSLSLFKWWWWLHCCWARHSWSVKWNIPPIGDSYLFLHFIRFSTFPTFTFKSIFKFIKHLGVVGCAFLPFAFHSPVIPRLCVMFHCTIVGYAAQLIFCQWCCLCETTFNQLSTAMLCCWLST